MQSTLSPATARGWNKGVAQTLFVAVMPVGSENKHNNIGILNLVDQSVPLADSTAPLARMVTSKWLNELGGEYSICFLYNDSRLKACYAFTGHR